MHVSFDQNYALILQRYYYFLAFCFVEVLIVILPCVSTEYIMFLMNFLEFIGCLMEEDEVWGISWGNTPHGQTDIQRCPQGPGSYADNEINACLSLVKMFF